MSRYGHFPDSEFPNVTVSASFDTRRFGELELVGILLQIKEMGKIFIDRIGVGGSIIAKPLIHDGTIYVDAADMNMYALSVCTEP